MLLLLFCGSLRVTLLRLLTSPLESQNDGHHEGEDYKSTANTHLDHEPDSDWAVLDLGVLPLDAVVDDLDDREEDSCDASSSHSDLFASNADQGTKLRLPLKWIVHIEGEEGCAEARDDQVGREDVLLVLT